MAAVMAPAKKPEKPAELSPVEEAQLQVDEANQEHYALLKERDAVTEKIRANALELDQAVKALHEAEQAAKAVQAPDNSGASAPPDPPPTRVETGHAVDQAKAGA